MVSGRPIVKGASQPSMLTQQQQLMSPFNSNFGDHQCHHLIQKHQQFVHQQQIMQKQIQQHKENPVLSSLMPQPILRQSQPQQQMNYMMHSKQHIDPST